MTAPAFLPTAARRRRAEVLFLGRLYAGHRTRFSNLRAHTERDPRVHASYRAVSGWVQGGAVERLTWVPATVRGRMRATLEAGAFARIPRPDAIWTSATAEVGPYLWAQWGRMRRPLILDLDWTLDQQEVWAHEYYARRPRTGARLTLARARERALWRGTSMFTAWSTWTAGALADRGVESERIRVLPPGVDLDLWRPADSGPHRSDAPLRLLFVGGDFERKGGPLLVDLVRTRFRGRCELDVVTTHGGVPASPAVRVHRAEANSLALRDLHARSDLFVLPSPAECFGIATVEAMASARPVIVGDVGGAADIVEQGRTGWRIPTTAPALADALELALARRAGLPAMGRRGRIVAERRFDGRRNDEEVVDLILQQIAAHAGP